MKIKEEQLETIRKQQEDVNNLLNNIGYLQAQQHGLLHQLGEMNVGIENFKNEMEKEYGAVNINLETGEYTPLETKEEPEMKVVENVE